MSDSAHDSHDFHLPPNSWVPISFSLSLALTFIGLLIHPAVWIVGLIWFIATLYAWFRGARTEYLELPE